MSGENGVYLGIDTATPFLSLGLCDASGSALGAYSERVEREHAARLITALDELLRTAGTERTDLAGIAVGNGPGSYTGLRVAGAAARGIAQALDIPLSGCDTLAALAFGGLQEGEEGWAVLDARRGNVYAGRYRREGDRLAVVVAPHKRSRSDIPANAEGARIVEERAPDPGYLARCALLHLPYRPVYL